MYSVELCHLAGMPCPVKSTCSTHNYYTRWTVCEFEKERRNMGFVILSVIFSKHLRSWILLWMLYLRSWPELVGRQSWALFAVVVLQCFQNSIQRFFFGCMMQFWTSQWRYVPLVDLEWLKFSYGMLYI